ncbi:MAG TPA: hypothetical protein VH540_26010 [Ktedonobacterales bacterium]
MASANVGAGDGGWRLKAAPMGLRPPNLPTQVPPTQPAVATDGDGSPRRRTWWRPQTPLGAAFNRQPPSPAPTFALATLRRQGRRRYPQRGHGKQDVTGAVAPGGCAGA